MKTLLLMRHAKSSWADPTQSDFDRPLNDRGRRDAPQMGRLVVEQQLVPDVILCSTAARARQTLEGMNAGDERLNIADAAWEGRIYHATPTEMLRVIREYGEAEDRILLIGHNPGLQELVFLLTGCQESFPTAALAVIALPIDAWADLSEQTIGKLLKLFRPKELDFEDAPPAMG